MILNSFATRAVSSAVPRNARKRGSNAVTYCDRTSGVSRSGSTVTSSTCTLSPSVPSFFTAAASSASVVGHTSGQCVKPKNMTTTRPRKSASARGLPVWSVSAKSWPKSAPVMSVARKAGLPCWQAPSMSSRTSRNRRNAGFMASSRSDAEVVIHQQRGKQQRQVHDGVAEGFLRQFVAVGHENPDGVDQKQRAQHHRTGQVEQAAHAAGEWQRRYCDQDHGVEQHVQASEAITMGDRQHRDAGLRVLVLAVERQGPEMRRGPGENDQE